MTRVSEHISFSLSILYQILTHNLFLIQYFHGIEVSSANGRSIFLNVELLYNINLPKRTLAKLCSNSEVLWSNTIFLPILSKLFELLLFLLVQLITFLPKFDKFLFPHFLLVIILLFLLFCNV